MNTNPLAGLEPQNVFSYFAQICAIPHGSRNTTGITEYLVAFAEKHNLRYIRDDADNVIMFKPASRGYEDREPVILQGHTDMVCQKEESCPIDMEKEPVALTHDNTYVFAKGTTLGGDDGAGVALTLAILADDSIEHPALEAIFTSNEEIGLLGANAIDLSEIKGRRMLNLDTSHEGVFNVGCGGGARVAIEMPVEKESYEGAQWRISLENFHGGHSGSLIGRGYVNTNKAMAALLVKMGVKKIVSLTGGVAGNVIPSTTHAVVAAQGLDRQEAEGICREFEAQIRKENQEPNATVTLTVLSDGQAEALTADSVEKVLSVLQALPDGVQQWSPDFENLPLLSLNLGVLELKQDTLSMLTNVRSGVNRLREELLERLKMLAKEHGCVYGQSGVYSAWEYRAESPLRDTLVSIYRREFQEEPAVKVIHAGLECGVLGAKLPGLDCVSIGPNLPEIHTVRERMEIASMQRTWKFLLEILKAL